MSALLKIVVEQFEELGITTNTEHVRELVRQYCHADKGWEIPFTGGAIYGLYADRVATAARLEDGPDGLRVVIAARHIHGWMKHDSKEALRDISRQLDDLIYEQGVK